MRCRRWDQEGQQATFRQQWWPVVTVQPECRGPAIRLLLVFDTKHKSAVWLWTEPVIIQSAGEHFVIINWIVTCTLVPHIHVLPGYNVMYLTFFFPIFFTSKLIKQYEVRPDPAGTTVKAITRTLLCPAKPINLQFVDRRMEREEPRAAAGASLWGLLVFTLCRLPVTKHLFVERSHH